MSNVILYHHEHADGTGPFQKKWNEIPLFARIIHLADTIDIIGNNTGSGNNSWNLTFPDGKQEFLVQLNPETDISNIKITIQDVYTDRIEWQDTAITDIGLWYKED